MQRQEQYQQQVGQQPEMFIKGSGTSACLLTNRLDDQAQFIPFRIQNHKIIDVQLSGLFAVAIVTKDKQDIQTNQNKQQQQIKTIQLKKHVLKWGNLNQQLVHKPQLISLQPNVKIRAINCGWNHALIACQNGILLGFGENKFGQLGNHNQPIFYNQPVQVVDNKAEVKVFAAGFRQSYWVDPLNRIFGCGESKNYQIGVSNKKQVLSPTQIQIQQNKQITNIIKISCGKKFIILLTQNSEVYGIGANDYQCLNNTQTIKSVQKLTKIKQNIKDIRTGWNHIVYLDKQGRVFTKGRNNFGQLGREYKQSDGQVQIIQNCIQIESGTQFNFAVTECGKLYGWGWNQHMNIQNEEEKHIISKPILVRTPSHLHLQRCITYPAITIIKGKRTN